MNFMKKQILAKKMSKREKVFPEYFFLIYIVTRVLFLILMKILPVAPYFTYDDLNIYSKVDISDLSSDYFLLRQIYINICCILNSLLNGTIINGPRILNIIMYYFSVKEAALLCKTFDYGQDVINKICLTLVLMPQLIIVSCSMVKDVFLMYLVMRSIRGMIYIIEKRSQNYIWFGFVLILLYFARYGLLEILVVIFAVNFILRSKHKVLWFTIIAVIFMFVVYKVLSNPNYIYLLNQKLDVFTEDKSTDTGLMSYLRIHSPWQLYKLFFALPYMLTLGVPNFDQFTGSIILWLNIIGFFSFITMFMIPSFYIYSYKIVRNKRLNELLTLGYFTVYHIVAAINSPSLIRYMFCVYPIFIIFAVRQISEHKSLVYFIGVLFSSLYVVYLFLQLTVI